MIYLSIDIETTGIDPENCQIIEFGAIIEDTKKQLSFNDIPKFSTLVEYPLYKGEPFALSMHKEIFKELAQKHGQRTEPVTLPDNLGRVFYEWLVKNCPQLYVPTTYPYSDKTFPAEPIKINVAGKNFAGFDKNFLDRLYDFEEYVQFNHRFIDPASLYYDDSIDSAIPNLETCKKRAGIVDSTIAHRTLKDAWDVIEVLRGKMYPKL